MADNIANEVRDAHGGLEPIQVAGVIFRNLFEVGSQRMSATNKAIAIGTIMAGLVEWKKQILSSSHIELGKWQKLAQESKMEMETLKTQNAKLMKEAREL